MIAALPLDDAREVPTDLGDEPWFETVPVWGPFQQAWQRLLNLCYVDDSLLTVMEAGGPILRER